MKKLILFAIMIMATLAVSAQLNYKLVRFHDNYNIETTEFIYNTEHRLIATHDIFDEYQVYEWYDSLKYDNNGNLVRLECWQRLNGQFKFVNYIDYTYDAQNRITSRTNYNLISDEWTLGGVYSYIYDADGHHVRTTLVMSGDTMQVIEYTYEDGKLKDEIWKLADLYSGVLELSEKLTYSYDSLNRLSAMCDSTYGGSSYEFFKRHEYIYNADGNCEYHKAYDSQGEVERNAYTYCDKLKSETLMPYTPELTRPQHTEYNVNVYTLEEYWTLDADFVFQHLCDYVYEYIGINESGVEDVVNDAALRQIRNVKKVIIDGQLYIECDDNMYDINGRRVH